MIAVSILWAGAGTGMARRSEQGEAPRLEEVANTTYRGIYDDPVRLDHGLYEGEPTVAGGTARPRVELVRDFLLTGDIDRDGNDEAVVLLSESSGGAGENLYIAVVGRREGEPVNLGTALIGDRVQVRAFRITNQRIELDVLQAGPKDAACCPSQKATRIWALKGSGLDEVSSRVTGTFSLTDLGGMEWVLTHFDRDQRAPPEPEITLVFEAGRVTGTGGCNRYFAQIESGTMPGEITMGPVGSTRRACADEVLELERRYLKALGRALRYRFFAGRLVMTFQGSGGFGALIFTPRE